MDLPSVYTPENTEANWYPVWEKRGLFGSKPDPKRQPFTIVIPPPNVTGSLHMGHALNNTLQDVLTRWNRMKGNNSLWIPGTDHGGIATQNVVEKLLKKEGKSRHDFSRAEFLERMWRWRKESGDAILHQLRKLGASLDWSRLRFTMDEQSSRAVTEAFTRFYKDGLIYQGERLVNWCPRCTTALSDIEVEREERNGKLWHIKYPFVGESKEFIVVATTRPETLLGDMAVAVNPADERHKDAVGKELLLPLVNRVIPVIADEAIDAAFGTGAVKVTPAHDATDFEIGQRHRLKAEQVIDYQGKMTSKAGRYAGLSVKEAREKVVADLEARRLLVEVEDHRHAVSVCYRCNTTIEPLTSGQWFLKTKDMAARAAQATRDGRVKIHPESWEKPYLAWLDGNRDWCISRQIWWGHQIPVWYCLVCGDYSEEAERRIREDKEFRQEQTKAILRGSAKRPIVQAAPPAACPDCGGKDLVQDPDVLDTWFSSGLWPLTTLGWPAENQDLKYYYPTSVLATGHEILYLWVARMVMMGLALKNEVPYKDVFIHGIVRDKQGRKMSKSLNNVIDPLDIMKEYGTDALRYALVAAAAPGRDMQMANDTFVGARNFANKMWNATRFALMNIEGHRPVSASGAPGAASPASGPTGMALDKRQLADRWIRQRLADTLAEVDGYFAGFDLAQAARALYAFFRNDLCDWYIELVKPRLQAPEASDSRTAARDTLAEVLDAALRALHPIMPFITEELWLALGKATGRAGERTLLEMPYEAVERARAASPEDMRAMNLLMETVVALRTIRSEMNVPPGKPIAVVANLASASPFTREVLEKQSGDVRHLAKISDWRAVLESQRPPQSASSVAGDFEMFIPLEGLIDFAKEKQRLEKERAALEADVARLEERLNNPDFSTKAPPEKVAEVKDRLAESKAKRERLNGHLAALQN